MKDASCGDIGYEFFRIRSQVHLYETIRKILAKKIKGINTQVVKVSIEKEDYRNCLLEDEKIHRQQYDVNFNFHNSVTERQTKLALVANDDKRFIIPGTASTIAYGHTSIKKYINE